MNRRRPNPGRMLYLAAIRLLALRLPAGERSEWQRHWASELWYVYDASVSGRSGRFWHDHSTVAKFCFGAVHDVRSMNPPSGVPRQAPYARSAIQCLSMLAAGTVFSLVCVLFLPGARTALQPSPYRDPHTLVVISREGYSETLLPTIAVGQYRSWREGQGQFFSEFALYQPIARQVQIGPQQAATLTVASVTPNLFPVLGVSQPAAGRDEVPSLLLSEAAWRRHFRGRPQAVGTILTLGSRKVRLAGILKDGSWRLPSHVDAWLVEPDDDAAALSSTSLAFVVARQSSSGAEIAPGEYWHMLGPDAGADSDRPAPSLSGYDCVAVSAIARRPIDIFLFTVMLALLALPATTSLPLGEYPSNDGQHKQLSLSLRTRRWGFFFAKAAMLLPIVFFASVAAAHLFPGVQSTAAQYVQIATSFGGCLYGLRWALRDQRARCPVCLCKLTHACRVGEASRNFLAWNGTELLCAEGHGLLHVPELPTCWFPTQRWTYLDASWTALFVPSA